MRVLGKVQILWECHKTFTKYPNFLTFLTSNVKKLGDFFNFVAFTEYLNFSWCNVGSHLNFKTVRWKKRNVLQKVSWTLWPILLNYISRNHFSKGVKSFWPYITYQSQWCRELGIHTKRSSSIVKIVHLLSNLLFKRGDIWDPTFEEPVNL